MPEITVSIHLLILFLPIDMGEACRDAVRQYVVVFVALDVWNEIEGVHCA